jgi:hypothetical protein
MSISHPARTPARASAAAFDFDVVSDAPPLRPRTAPETKTPEPAPEAAAPKAPSEAAE